MLIVSTNLSGQTGSKPDSIKCYNTTELRKIAVIIIKKQECDTLLQISNKQLSIKDTIIKDKDSQITILKKESSYKQEQIQDLTKVIKKYNRQKNWLKLGIVGSILAGLTGIILLH